MTALLHRRRPLKRSLPFPVPALCSTPRGERASDGWDALHPDSTRCAATHRVGQGRRAFAAAPQARGATHSAGPTREHGEHAEEPSLEAPEHRGT